MPIQNVIAINSKCDKTNVSQNEQINTGSVAAIATPSTTETEQKQFTIVYAGRNENSSNRNKWRYKSITFSSSDAYVVQFWVNTLHRALNGEYASLCMCEVEWNGMNLLFLECNSRERNNKNVENKEIKIKVFRLNLRFK